MADTAVLADSSCTIPNEASRMQQSLESAQSALQSSSKLEIHRFVGPSVPNPPLSHRLLFAH